MHLKPVVHGTSSGMTTNAVSWEASKVNGFGGSGAIAGNTVREAWRLLLLSGVTASVLAYGDAITNPSLHDGQTWRKLTWTDSL